MLSVVVFGLMIGAMVLQKSNPPVSAGLNAATAVVVLVFSILPGSAGWLAWVILVVCSLQAGLYLYTRRTT